MRGPAATAPKGSHGRARSPCLVAQLQRGQQEGDKLCGHEPAAGDSSACPFCFAPHGARTWFMSCKRSTPHLGAFGAKRPVQLSIHYPFASFLPRWGCISSPVQPQEANAARSSLPERILLLCGRQDGSISLLLSAEPRQEAPPRGRASQPRSHLQTRLSKELTGLRLKKMLKEMISLSAMGDICL